MWIFRKGEDGRRTTAPALPLLLGDGALCGIRLDANRARFLLLRDLALELNRQQAVRELRGHDLHVVGELEVTLEAAARDATIEILLLGLAVTLHGLAGDLQFPFL